MLKSGCVKYAEKHIRSQQSFGLETKSQKMALGNLARSVNTNKTAFIEKLTQNGVMRVAENITERTRNNITLMVRLGKKRIKSP